MQTLCEDRFRQALYRKIEGAYLKSQNERNLDCIVTFQTHSILQRFMLRFDLLQLDCNDHLFIYDGAHAVDSYKDIIIDKKVLSKQLKLTTATKGLLRVPVEQRTEEEFELLLKSMGHLPCFDRYSEKIRDGLTTSAIFNYFPPGRVLVREGNPAVSMYFILSGQVGVTKMTFDPGEKKLKPVDVTLMNAGDAFGELVILHDEVWSTTVTTVAHTEVLMVLKETFRDILESFLGETKREISKCLDLFSYFKDWNHGTVLECCILARIVRYDNDVLIMGDNCGNSENSYFVISGSCRVIYQLQIEHIPRKNFTELRVIETDSIAQEDSNLSSDLMRNIERQRLQKIEDPFVTGLVVDRLLRQMLNELPIRDFRTSDTAEMTKILVQSHFFQIAQLIPGACFGIGENLDKKFILSSASPVTLLCIPKFFLKSHNIGNVWGRVREFFNHTYPSPQTIFQQFLMDRKWNKSRAKYLHRLIKVDRPFTGLTVAEAPYYTRLTTDYENPVFKRIEKILWEKKKKK